MNASKIHTVIFDIGKVLVSFEWKDFVHRYYPDDAVAEQASAAFWKNGYWDELDRGVLPVQEILQGFISNAPDYEKEIRHLFENLGDSVAQYPYAKEWITDLRHKGYQVLFLSNYSEYLIERNPSALDFIPLMDGGIFSCRVKCIKPGREIYQKLCEKYQLNPSECVFIDDRADNVAAANAFGIHGIQFTEYQETRDLCEQMLQNK